MCGWLGSPCSPSGSTHATSLPRQQTPSQQQVRTPLVAKKSESPDLGGPMGLLQSLKLMVTESHRKATTQRVESRNSSRVNSDDLPATSHGPKHGLYFGLMGAWYGQPTHQAHCTCILVVDSYNFYLPYDMYHCIIEFVSFLGYECVRERESIPPLQGIDVICVLNIDFANPKPMWHFKPRSPPPPIFGHRISQCFIIIVKVCKSCS